MQRLHLLTRSWLHCNQERVGRASEWSASENKFSWTGHIKVIAVGRIESLVVRSVLHPLCLEFSRPFFSAGPETQNTKSRDLKNQNL